MLQPNDLRLTAVELRARARAETNPDFRSEFILLAERYEDLAESTENFQTALEQRAARRP
jgi:hypothetical protein